VLCKTVRRLSISHTISAPTHLGFASVATNWKALEDIPFMISLKEKQTAESVWCARRSHSMSPDETITICTLRAVKKSQENLESVGRRISPSTWARTLNKSSLGSSRWCAMISGWQDTSRSGSR
jgi:hypothetical protein